MNQSTNHEKGQPNNQPEFQNYQEFANDFTEPIIVHLPRYYTIRQTINHILKTYDEKHSFGILNLASLKQNHEQWQRNLPEIHPYYAVKSNPDLRILQTLASLGCNFACESKKEFEVVLKLVNDPNRIIFSHPIKIPDHIEYAKSIGIDRMTVDCIEELEKCLKLNKEATIILRLKGEEVIQESKLSKKFGASLKEAEIMLNFAKKHNQCLVGVGFSIDWKNHSEINFQNLIAKSAEVFKIGISIGLKMNVLDIGGGFSNTLNSFKVISAVINSAVTAHFGYIKDLKVIAEPGRYFSRTTNTIVTSVIGKKQLLDPTQKGFRYFLDEGAYGNFHSLFYRPKDEIKLRFLKEDYGKESYSSFLYGPTCDYKDGIGEHFVPELEIGDRLFFENLGDYSFTMRKTFNSFEDVVRYQIIYE